MIAIKKTFLVELTHKTRLCCVIEVDGIAQELWFEVENEYAPCLCTERSDAYVIGLLNWAMRHRHDITCELPMCEELHYQLTAFLIPALAKTSKNLYPVRIIAPLDNGLISNAGAVGSGLSCGIDSLHVLANQSDSPYPSLNITHLLYNNVGSHGVGKPDSMLEHEQIAEAFATEMGYKLIKTDSNFAEIFEQTYSQVHTFSNCFAVYLLQKLWNVYFYASSGLDFSEFNLKNNDSRDSAYYDLLSLDCFSTRSLRIYSEGGAKTRFEKTKTVIACPPAGKYLTVCCAEGKNCGKCEKCMRTLLTLDALNVLDKFDKVFDIDYYRTHKNDYYSWLCVRKMQKDPLLKETFAILSRKVSLFQWALALFEMIKIPLRRVFVKRKKIPADIPFPAFLR
jgi:bacterioferritin-associated ferredoxin